MHNAVAFADHDVVTIAWSYGQKPDGCMGFAIYRVDNRGKEAVLPSHAADSHRCSQVAFSRTTSPNSPIASSNWRSDR